jgi:gluconolactonase
MRALLRLGLMFALFGCGHTDGAVQAGSGGGLPSGGTGGGGAGGVGGTPSGGAGGQGGEITGGTTGSGGAGGTGGVGGAGGMVMPPMDGGGAAMPALDAGSDAGATQPLAARVCPPAGTVFGDPLPPEGQRTAAIVPGSQAGFVFLEGPLWLADQGVLLFTDMDFGSANSNLGPPARIRKLTPPSAFSVFAEMGNSNGLALDLEGDVLACSHDVQSLSRFDATTAMRTPLTALRYDGKRFNSPNDLTVRSDGTIYFTDPDYQLPPRDSETGATNVYRVTPAGVVHLVIGTLDKPNGIALSPDERTLYVGSTSSMILKFPVNADGSLGDSSLHVDTGGGSDGFAIDCAGNLYTTGGGQVQVWKANGDPLGAISVPQGPSNAAFGGAERKTLFITARTALYSIELNVPGLPY